MVDSEHPTWLVTGARGFLGANAGAYLAGKAHRIGASRHGEPDDLFDESLAADLLDPTALTRVIAETRPDVVLHSAALAYHDRCEADPELAHAINVTASVQLAQAANDVGARFVLISTDAVFDGTRGHHTELDPPSPSSVYGRTKVQAEAEVTQATDALIVRTNFFGWSPTGQRSILEFFVNELGAGRPVRGFTDFTTSSAYAQVLVDTIWRLTQVRASGVFHVTSPDSMTKYDFGVAVAEAFGLDAGLITPTRADIQPPREGDISLDVRKVQSTIGSVLPTMRTGIGLALADADGIGNLVRRSQ